ncbi:MAG: type II toxin-antitoxin system RelE/ParE family toxin [Cytophagaceae bacterium]|nr:type II toxin-antitoxin system RelE/ParE family toxin [Cytophagaceae bacterium]
MATVVWSEKASDDVEKLAEYLAEESPPYASRLVELLYAKTDLLEKFPRVGRVVPEFEIDSIREIIFPPYRIIYELLDEDLVLIQKVFHSSRNPENLKKRGQLTAFFYAQNLRKSLAGRASKLAHGLGQTFTVNGQAGSGIIFAEECKAGDNVVLRRKK